LRCSGLRYGYASHSQGDVGEQHALRQIVVNLPAAGLDEARKPVPGRADLFARSGVIGGESEQAALANGIGKRARVVVARVEMARGAPAKSFQNGLR
jgi:hypothetical protein